ncbi:MAG: DNA polymerase [Gallintestinimicrobium sp.]
MTKLRCRYPVCFMRWKKRALVRRQELQAYGDALVDRINELETKIHEAAGCEFNINSPKQLGEILFEKMGLKGGKKTKTGYSTAADILKSSQQTIRLLRISWNIGG